MERIYMASVNKCCQCDDITEQLLGICVECVESIMKSLNAPIEPQNSSQVSLTANRKCGCKINLRDALKVDSLINDCDEATAKMNKRNIDETKRRKTAKS
mgnify:CR=1 FL=1|tara:strand:- start:26721 stop:27020 length:300 start_codon:yes stop_codon:yes gene_type:complete